MFRPKITRNKVSRFEPLFFPPRAACAVFHEHGRALQCAEHDGRPGKGGGRAASARGRLSGVASDWVCFCRLPTSPLVMQEAASVVVGCGSHAAMGGARWVATIAKAVAVPQKSAL